MQPTPSKPDPLRLYTLPEVAKLWSLSLRTVESLVASGELPSLVIGRRSRRVSAEALSAYLARRQAAASPSVASSARPPRNGNASRADYWANPTWPPRKEE